MSYVTIFIPSLDSLNYVTYEDRIYFTNMIIQIWLQHEFKYRLLALHTHKLQFNRERNA